jgi:DUF438 domain-containing protein
MDRCKDNRLAEELADFLLKLNNGKGNNGLRKEANRLLSSISPDDIAKAERELAKNGLSLKKIQQLSASFILMGVLEENETDLRARLSGGHILRKIMAEHEMTICFLADLEDIAAQIRQKDSLTPTSGEFMRLAHIVEHLNSLEEHMDRENDVLFPALSRQGWQSLFTHIEHEHTYIQMSINDLVKLITTFDKMPFNNFKTRLLATVRYLCPLLREHLSREDRAIFPLAVSMIRDDKVWDRLRRICNEIDYCGIHL